jgi:hypothetical protein
MVEFAYSFEESTLETTTASQGVENARTFRVKRKSPTKTSEKYERPAAPAHMVEFAHSFEESTLETTTASQGAKNDERSE